MCVTILEQASQCQLGSDALYSIVPLIPAIAGFLCPTLKLGPARRVRAAASLPPPGPLWRGHNSRDTLDTGYTCPIKVATKLRGTQYLEKILRFVMRRPFLRKLAPPPLPRV